MFRLSKIGPLVHALAGLIPLAWGHVVSNNGYLSDLPNPGLIAFCVLLALLPDIDTHSSVLGRLVPEISRAIERHYGHRSITHSFAANLVVAGVTYLLAPDWLALTLAYTSHLIIDMIVGGESGVPLLWPLPWRMRLMQVSPATRGELATGVLALAFVLLPFAAPVTASEARSIIPSRPTPTPTRTPIPPTPVTVSIRIDHVADPDNEILVHVGDRIQQGDLIANLMTLKKKHLLDSLAQIAASKHTLPSPLLSPTQGEIQRGLGNRTLTVGQLLASSSTPTPEAAPSVPLLEIAEANAMLQIAIAQATAAAERAYPDASDLFAAEAALAINARELQQAQSAYDQEKWKPNVAMLPVSLALERATNNYNLAAARATSVAKIDYQALDLASARLQQDYINYQQRIATPTPRNSATPTPTSTPTKIPTPTRTATPLPLLDASKVEIRSLIAGTIVDIRIISITGNEATVEIQVAPAHGQSPVQPPNLPEAGTSRAVTANGSISTAFTHTGVDIEQLLIERIQAAQRTIDMAAFELNLDRVADSLLDAHRRGVAVRFITDEEYGLGEDTEPGHGQFSRLQAAGIEVRDDGRESLMHNKFWIFDGQAVWTGSTNITTNGTQRNNNNVILFDAPAMAEIYQAEFDELWAGQFGPDSPSAVGSQAVELDGVPVEVWFGPEDGVGDRLVELILDAQESIRFMAFSFTHDGMGTAMQQKAQELGNVQGIFEARGSGTEYSELSRLHCESIADVRTDGNPGAMHHKVIVLDEQIVVTGSFNFSANANERNDENLVIVWDEGIALAYLAEFGRRWGEGSVVGGVCD